ncbi:MAG: hypothetical protein RIR96_1637 [Bacteroidota bacterium]
MIIFLQESHCKDDLMPFTTFRHTCDIRVGMLTIREKWSILFPDAEIVDVHPNEKENVIEVPANIIPTKADAQLILSHYSSNSIDVSSKHTFNTLKYPWEIFQWGDSASRSDYTLLKGARVKTTDEFPAIQIGNQIFIEEGAKISHCTLNSETGPIFISLGAQIMEGANIRGPFFMGKEAVVKMGARIYGATSIGNRTVVGGELKNAVILDHSQKAHDGYLGDSVIGSWCNIGAGTSNSNVKNTFGEIFFLTKQGEHKISAGTKAGLIMGDYSKCAINSSFYTGTFVGVCCNLFGSEIHDRYVSDFTWGKSKYDLEKLILHINQWRLNTGNSVLDSNEIEKIKNAYQQ